MKAMMPSAAGTGEQGVRSPSPSRPTAAAAARPTIISAKYRLKEERRKVLKLSVCKLRRIEDPESALRRSVLINNTVRRLQREQREARADRATPCPSSSPALSAALGSTHSTGFTEPPCDPPRLSMREDDFPVGLDPLDSPQPAGGMVLEELEDVLSQFYMPPTPRMITSIDEDDDFDVESTVSTASPVRRSSSGSRSPSKRPRMERMDRLDDEDARALADPTNTLEDFKDEVYMRTKPLPRTPLSSANAPMGEDTLRAELCGRRFTGHDRENIAPLNSSTGLVQGPLVGMGTAGGPASSAPAAGAGTGAGAGAAVSLQMQPYSCGQAHGQVSMQSGLVFHGFMATMES